MGQAASEPALGANEQLSRREQFELKLKCAEAGRRFEADMERGSAKGIEFLASRFAYNPRLNTCIYDGGFIRGSIRVRSIVDLATNEQLASYRTDDSKTTGHPDAEQEFDRRERELLEPPQK
jgi:hypothetical protein